MDQRFRISVACGVMLLGLTVSMGFRRTGNSQPVALRSEPLVLRQQPGASSAAGPAQSAFAPAPPLPPLDPEPKHLMPATGDAPKPAAPADPSAAPEIGPSYPGPADANAAVQMGLKPHRKRTHRIVDGDSLAELAERYLGSASRAEEIFAANRDVLDSPQLLPIGAELKIPQSTSIAGR